MLTINYGKENGRNLDEIPSRRIRAKSVHACSREFYFLSLPFFLSFFLPFFFFLSFQFLFSFCMYIYACIYMCVFPLFSCFSPPFFLSFFFFSSIDLQKKEESLETKLLIALRVREAGACRSLDKLHNLPNGFVLLRLFFSFLSYLSALYRVCTCVRVCVCVCEAGGGFARKTLK